MSLVPTDGATGPPRPDEPRHAEQGAGVATRARRALAAALLIGSVTAGAVVTGTALERIGGPGGGDQEPAGAAQAPSPDGREVPGQPAGIASHSANHGDHAMAEPPAEPSAGAGQGGGLVVASDQYVLAPGPTRFATGKAGAFTFRILDPSGRPVTRFKRVHEKLLHMIVVRRDLTGYQHLHPALADDGTWSTRLTLPTAGVWRAFTDFVTESGAQTLGVDLFAGGRFEAAALPEPSAVATVAGYEVAMDAARGMRAGQVGELRFQVSREGWTVADLEPYLGARGHLVALREGDLAYLHVHPMDGASPGASIRFHAAFPSPGRYRLFLQFQHAGQVRTAAFTVEVH
jgi:hypothetical protein